jgi:hypothetical protein
LIGRASSAFHPGPQGVLIIADLHEQGRLAVLLDVLLSIVGIVFALVLLALIIADLRR